MKVSIIVPVYNHAQYLSQRLDSILYQTYTDYELIILDDASTDNSREIILEYAGKYPGIILSFNDSNSGSPFRQWNKGMSLAKGEYIWIAESDDYAEPRFLESLLNEIMKSEMIGLVCCDTWIRDEEKNITYRFSQKMKTIGNTVKTLTPGFFTRNPIPNVSSVLFRRSAYIKAGGADETMNYCGDWMMYVKVLHNYSIVYFPDTLSTCRLHAKSHYHLHYMSNVFLKERLKISFTLMRQIGFSVNMFFLMKDTMVGVLLRLVHFLHFPEAIMPELPRRPK